MNDKFDALILAGGFGTRMSKNFPDIPKPLIPVAGVPILEHILMECKEHEINNVLISVFHQKEKIIEFVGDGSKFGLQIDYVVEDSPIGTGGALFLAKERLADDFLVLYADVFSKLDLRQLKRYHLQNSSDVTCVVHPNDHPFDSDLVECDEHDNIIRLLPKDVQRPKFYKNYAAAAMYCLSKSIFQIKMNLTKFDIATDLVPILIDMGMKVKAYHSVEYVKDMGSPERHAKVESALENSIHVSRSSKLKRNAVILDRDGTINAENGHICNVDELELLDGAADAIRLLNQSKFLVLCATNQPVIARGDVTPQGLSEIHKKLDTHLGLHGAYLDDLVYCPHHPEMGFEGEIKSLKIDCKCRKPNSGMIDSYVAKFDLDAQNSILVGDRFSDITAAEGGGINSVLLLTGAKDKQNHLACRPTNYAQSLSDATSWILNDFQKLFEIAQKISSERRLSNRSIRLVGRSEDHCRSVARILQQHLIPNSVIFDFHGESVLNRYRIRTVEKKLVAMLTKLSVGEIAKYPEVIAFAGCRQIWVTSDKILNESSTIIVTTGNRKISMIDEGIYDSYTIEI